MLDQQLVTHLIPETGRTLIEAYLHDPNHDTTIITDDIACAVREHQSFLPEAATTDRALALRCLSTNRRNTICIHHHKTHSGKNYDGGPKARFMVTGVDQPRMVKMKKNSVSRLAQGFLSCGCSKEIALFDFFFWKTATAQNSKGTVEGLLTMRIEPRPRIFFWDFFKQYTGLTIDDLYTHGRPSVAVRKQRLCTQIERLKDNLAALTEEGNDCEFRSAW